MKENTTERIIEFFKENDEIFNACVEELDGYNGFLQDDRYYEMEMLNEFYCNTEPLELLYRVYYGRDDDSYTTDIHGEKHYNEFNPNREYFYYNGYGNLISSDYKDYTVHLDHYLIEEMLENRYYIDSIEDNDELSALFDELEEENDND